MDAYSLINQTHRQRDGGCSCGWRGADYWAHRRQMLSREDTRSYLEAVIIPAEIARGPR